MKVDFIRGIHGYAIELETLLIRLEYNNNNKVYFFHPDGSTVIFVGDFID
jgi:hypothetical protein